MSNEYQDIRIFEARGDYFNLRDSRVEEEVYTLSDTGFKNALVDFLYPVGSIYISMSSSAPFSRGTWEQIGKGEALVGVDSESEFEELNTVGNEFGSADTVLPEHTHTAETVGPLEARTVTEGSHRHSMQKVWSNGHDTSPVTQSGYAKTAERKLKEIYTAMDGDHNHISAVVAHTHSIESSGTSATNTNYPPSITVYIWKRTE